MKMQQISHGDQIFDVIPIIMSEFGLSSDESVSYDTALEVMKRGGTMYAEYLMNFSRKDKPELSFNDFVNMRGR